MSLLAQIKEPDDLASLSFEQLTQLVKEIRNFLIDQLSVTGGHLSPNLGVVELTVAIHRCFDSPRDRIIWDVGHQAYVHKLLTGRQQEFDSLREWGGLSGYPSREESPHDWVENSHASTSISYALGHALTNPDYWTVAVIGDGALTGGMAYEALNHMRVTKPPRLMVIFNDNGRSYDETVGGLATLAHLSHYRIDPRYEKAKHAIGRILRGLPLVGETADELATRVKDAFKQILEPSTLFDALGLKYSGQVDGHNIRQLEDTIRQAKTYQEPVIIHAKTEKGKGYPPAIADPVDKLHGVGAFDKETGKPNRTAITLTKVAGAALLQAARSQPELVAISAAMISSTGLKPMAEEFPHRVFDPGIAEQHTVTLAAGMAMAGRRPVVAIYSSFLQRAFDQIINDVALHDLPVVFLLDRAGITGPDGPSHHGAFDLAYLRMIPGMTVGTPANGKEMVGMLATALSHPGPIALRFPKMEVTEMPSLTTPPIPIGKWEILQEGEQLLLLATGRMVEVAQQTSEILAAEGWSCGVVNSRWVKPLDPKLADLAAEYSHVYTLEDGVATGGFGSAVLEHLSAAGSEVPVTVFGIPDRFLPHGSASKVLAEAGLNPISIAQQIQRTGVLASW